MTHIRINTGMFGLLLLAGYAACASKSSNAVPEQRSVGVVVDGSSMALIAAQGFYMASSNTTTVSGANGAGYPHLNLRFPGNKVGTFTCGANAGIDYTPAAGTTYIAGAGGDCTITVTSYGAVGEAITGTFSATPKSGAASLKLTQGGFNVVRRSDL
jgi:hypothetical protein